ncbi:S-adenosyl-L-methionine-dependent methyltransferase [Parachaetomium inaequale]|uniref:S-adenosyl-L-methionine-dependent methyltransferase n=1 Tax=Parachaetomium inaequale TaxID=2588326 RepID=A0AAN6STZ0_9PEZI|nr:S-adenosyl-L-methionine-dependent methyltransferase [Parachaetomium inaequale]
MPAATATTAAGDGETTDLSTQYDTPLGLAHTTMQALKDRIKLHYDLASDYYLNLWGEHIHHGYWPTATSKATDSKETAQLNLIRLLLSISSLSPPQGREELKEQQQLRILDVGCGVGGTTRYLASELGAAVTGITISGKQVQIAGRLSKAAAAAAAATPGVDGTGNGDGEDGAADGDGDGSKAEEGDGFIPLGDRGGKVRFIELDAEKMGEFFSPSGGGGQAGGGFDVVWISEALSHFPNKALFFHNAHKLLRPGGKLVLADWFRAEGLGEGVFEADIKPIEDGMLLPPLCTQQEYVNLATGAGLEVLGGPKDISKDVSKTWDISWSLVQNPSLWAFAFSQGRDGIAFLQAFRAMRRGYANGSFRYAVMAFAKP